MVLKIFYTFLTILAGILLYQVYLMYDAKASLSNQPAQYMIGPEEADLIVTEFLDYSCSYCQIMYPTLKEAMEQDGRVRLAPQVPHLALAAAVWPQLAGGSEDGGGGVRIEGDYGLRKTRALFCYVSGLGLGLNFETRFIVYGVYATAYTVQCYYY